MSEKPPSIYRQLREAMGRRPVTLVLKDGTRIPVDVITNINRHSDTQGSSTVVGVAVTYGGQLWLDLDDISEVCDHEPPPIPGRNT